MMPKFADVACALLAALLLTACEREPVVSTATPTTAAPVALPPLPRTYAVTRTIEAGVGQPRGIALDARGRLYIAGRQLRILNADQSEAARWDLEGEAGCVAVNDDGTLYVGMNSGPQNRGAHVRKYDAAGKLAASWGKVGRGPGELSILTGMAVIEGRLCVADPGNRCIHRFALDGDFVDDLGRRGDGSAGIVCPSPFLDCAAGPRGALLAPNPGMWRVDTYSPSGERTAGWGESGTKPHQFTGCCNPTNIAVMADGSIVVTEKRGPRLKVYDASGALLAFVSGNVFYPDAAGIDIACDANGRIYALDPVAGKILVFEQTKNPT